ncbi:MAG TPA: hypothetical protein VK138_02285 [Acidiferrobacterales bacterium]|nr:hypothetical protein [Acidiferrobacterales bacterium]
MANDLTEKEARTKLNGEGPRLQLGQYIQDVVRIFEGAAHYLKTHDTSTIKNDLAGRVRDYPVGTVIIGFGVGFLLGKILK